LPTITSRKARLPSTLVHSAFIGVFSDDW